MISVEKKLGKCGAYYVINILSKAVNELHIGGWIHGDLHGLLTFCIFVIFMHLIPLNLCIPHVFCSYTCLFKISSFKYNHEFRYLV